MLKNYEENPGTGKPVIQEPVSLHLSTRADLSWIIIFVD